MTLELTEGEYSEQFTRIHWHNVTELDVTSMLQGALDTGTRELTLRLSVVAADGETLSFSLSPGKLWTWSRWEPWTIFCGIKVDRLSVPHCFSPLFLLCHHLALHTVILFILCLCRHACSFLCSSPLLPPSTISGINSTRAPGDVRVSRSTHQ